MAILTTERLILRQFTLADTEEIYRYSKEASLGKWIPDQVYADLGKAREALEFLISRYEPVRFPYVVAVELEDGNKLIGHAGFSQVKRGIEVGYAIGEKYQNFGYAAEAVGAFTDWGKNQLNLPCIYGIVDAQNMASCKVLEKLGFLLVNDGDSGEPEKKLSKKTYVK